MLLNKPALGKLESIVARTAMTVIGIDPTPIKLRALCASVVKKVSSEARATAT